MHGITNHQTTNFIHRRKNTEFPTTYTPVTVQEDSTIYSLFISPNRFTCFGWYLHPSSGVHVTVNDENSGQQHLRQESKYHPEIRPERYIADPASYVRSSHRNSKENHTQKNFNWILPSTSNTLSWSLKLCSVIQRPNFRISLWTDTLSYEPRTRVKVPQNFPKAFCAHPYCYAIIDLGERSTNTEQRIRDKGAYIPIPSCSLSSKNGHM